MSDADNYFGPQVNGYFDFTVLFEQSILSILPTALIILLAPVRITWLLRNDIRVRAGKLLWLKLVMSNSMAKQVSYNELIREGRNFCVPMPPDRSHSTMVHTINTQSSHLGRRKRAGLDRSNRPRCPILHGAQAFHQAFGTHRPVSVSYHRPRHRASQNTMAQRWSEIGRGHLYCLFGSQGGRSRS